jgi:hypothetical protein
MRRFQSPFNGKRFLLNINTGEIHDLDNETAECQIDKIKPEHIRMDNSYMSCLIYSKMMNYPNGNGCYYCLRDKDKRV